MKNRWPEGFFPSFSEPRSFLKGRGERAGFTIVEIAVVLMIITAISAGVLFSFTGLHESSAINRGARELALAIRRAQNMSLAVTQIDTQAGRVIPSAIGVRLEVGSPIYFIFADIVPDNKYSAEVILGAVDAKVTDGQSTFDGGIIVHSLTSYDSLCAPYANPVAHVMFLAPEATVVLSDGNGNSLGDQLDIGLISASGSVKKIITVRASGQISIKTANTCP